MPPKDQTAVKKPVSKLDTEVMEEIAKIRGASLEDINLELSLTEDMGLNPGEIEDLFRELANHFGLRFEDLKGQHFKDVGEIAEAIEDLLSFE